MHRTRLTRFGTLSALVAAAVLVLTGCTSPEHGGAAESVRVVATTNVYGDIVRSIGGERVDVTDIITSASQDPHSYEATARDRLAVQQADLVIENGGGYDAFLAALREGSSAIVLTAVEFNHDFPGAEEAGHDHAEDADQAHEGDAAEDEHGHHGHNHIEGFNEHVWFDAHTMIHLAEAIAEELTVLDPAGAEDFAAGAAELIGELEQREEELAQIAADHAGAPVFLTEPLAGYLAAGAGLLDHAPDGFASAVEEGADVAPATLRDALAVIDSGDVVLVFSNAQTGGAETERIETQARDAGIPVIAFTEILPDGVGYTQWLAAAIVDLRAALEG